MWYEGRVLAPGKGTRDQRSFFIHEEDTLLIGLRGSSKGHSSGENTVTLGSRRPSQLKGLAHPVSLATAQVLELLGPTVWLPNEPNLIHITLPRLSKITLKG